MSWRAVAPPAPAVRCGRLTSIGIGGLVSNTPLQHVLDNAACHHILVFQVDLFSARCAVCVARLEHIEYCSRMLLLGPLLPGETRSRRAAEEKAGEGSGRPVGRRECAAKARLAHMPRPPSCTSSTSTRDPGQGFRVQSDVDALSTANLRPPSTVRTLRTLPRIRGAWRRRTRPWCMTFIASTT